MLIFLIIFQYLVLASLDVSDKFLITKRKLEPFKYTFFTVGTGVVLLFIWPWVYAHLSLRFVLFDVAAGGWFSLAALVFYWALSEGEVSRVVPFVYGFVTVFDIIFQQVFKISDIHLQQFAAFCLLVPGALLLTYKKGKFLGKHAALKLLAAAMISAYNLLWHFSSRFGPVLNGLMWNRVGASLMVLAFLLLPLARKRIFATEHVEKKINTSFVFLAKQLVGGLNFVFISFLYATASVPVVDSLQGFRYIFLLSGSLFLSRKHKHIIEEDVDKHTIRQKLIAIGLIFAGTIILFI